MTDRPTVALMPGQWRDLVLGNVARIHQWVTSKESITGDELKQLHDGLEQTKSFTSAWLASVAPVQAETVAPAESVNGAQPPKKRRGRPPKQPAQQVATQ
jgi:hypothetical protein